MDKSCKYSQNPQENSNLIVLAWLFYALQSHLGVTELVYSTLSFLHVDGVDSDCSMNMCLTMLEI